MTTETSTQSSINNTLAGMLRRTFGKVSREEALEAFVSVLDNTSQNEACDLVRSEVLKVYNQAPPGARLSREVLLEKLSGLVGESLPTKKALTDTLANVLQGSEFVGHRGRNGGFELATPRALSVSELETMRDSISAQLSETMEADSETTESESDSSDSE